MKQQVIVGLDIGTSSLKTTLLDAKSGKTIQNLRSSYLGTDGSLGIVYVKVFEDAIASVLNEISQKYDVLAVGVSTQMYSICQDTKEGRVVYQWNANWDKGIQDEGSYRQKYQETGCPPDTHYPSYRLLTADEQLRKSFLPFGLKEHLLQYMTGELVTDYSTASASGFFNIRTKKWDADTVAKAGFEMHQMPELKKHNEIAGFLKSGLIGNMSNKITVVPALGDGVSASYACSHISRLCCNIGTSMAARVYTDHVPEILEPPVWIYTVDDQNYVEGIITPNGYSVLNWAKKIGWDNNSMLIPNGDLMFFPWLLNEAKMSNDGGMFVGINTCSDINMIHTAIIKGVAFNLARIFGMLSSHYSPDSIAILSGGGVHIKSLMEAFLGVIPIKIGILNEYEYLASYGAAISAASALKIKPENKLVLLESIEPNGKYCIEYDRWLKRAESLA